MSILNRLVNLFSSSGRKDNLLRQAMEHASANRPEQAISIYDSLVNSKSTDVVTRSRVLLNRALAHSAMKSYVKETSDLQEVVSMPGAPDNVVTAAKMRLVRVRNRKDRREARITQIPDRKAG